MFERNFFFVKNQRIYIKEDFISLIVFDVKQDFTETKVSVSLVNNTGC